MPEEQSLEGVPPPGVRTLGRYTLVAKLAVGGMAEIYLARQHSVGGFEKVLVVKKILDNYAADSGFVSMFLDEARIAAQLNHPNIVQIFDLGQVGATYFIAMEYLAGESVSRLVRRALERGTPLPVHLTAQLIAQAADGLHYAHTATDNAGRPLGIVHRDISPQNLVVTYTGVVKVVDFGIALAANRSSQTEQGKLKGKLSYMSPEQARGLPVDARSDVFALGIVLYEALTGSRLFAQDDPAIIFGQMLSPMPLPRASSRNPDVPFELDEIVAGALRKNRNERYQSAKELQEALTEWLHHAEFDRQETLADFMTGLFAVEKERRLRVLDQAARGEEISTGTHTGPGTAGTERSMPDAARPELPPALPPRPPNRLGWGLAAAGVTIGVGVIGAYFALRSPLHPLPAPGPSTIPIPAPPPPPLPASLDIHASPAEAHILVDGSDRGPSPLHLSELPLGPHQVILRLDGRPDVTRTVSVERPGQSVDLTLEMPAAPPPPPPPVVETAPPVAAHPKHASPSEKEHAAAGRGATGLLNFDSAPWGEVTIDGKAMGETPLIGVALPAGSHSVVVSNPDQGLSQTITVIIKAGETTAKKVKL